jgi:penicillin-binding protein 1A
VKILVWLAALGALACSLVFGIVYFEAQSLPSLEALKSSQNGQTILVRARDGSQLVVIGPSYGQWLDYDRIPSVMKDAIVSTEDRRFRDHIGIDPIGMMRSAAVNAKSGHRRQGASTITQQLARNIFLNNDRTFSRKIKEIFIAWRWSGSSPRTRSSNSTSTRSISAAAPTAWTRPAASSSAIPAPSSACPRPRSSRAW